MNPSFRRLENILTVKATSSHHWLAVYLISSTIKTHCSSLPVSCSPAQTPSALRHILLFPSQQRSYSLITVSSFLSDTPNTQSSATKMSGAAYLHTWHFVPHMLALHFQYYTHICKFHVTFYAQCVFLVNPITPELWGGRPLPWK